jgi:hypothetical protein
MKVCYELPFFTFINIPRFIFPRCVQKNRFLHVPGNINLCKTWARRALMTKCIPNFFNSLVIWPSSFLINFNKYLKRWHFMANKNWFSYFTYSEIKTKTIESLARKKTAFQKLTIILSEINLKNSHDMHTITRYYNIVTGICLYRDCHKILIIITLIYF